MRVPFGWMKEFTDGWHHSPDEVALLLTMAGVEVEAVEQRGDESVLTLAVTPNRPDCLSIYGVGREVAAICKGRIKRYSVKPSAGTGVIAHDLRVTVDDAQGCPRYTAQRISGVRVGPSPQWVQRRLEAVGVRPINNVVDATNYVMFELGQPLHAFDAGHIMGRQIGVRRAAQGQTFTTLDTAEHHLHADDLLICDQNRPVALAGIMGGANAEVSDQTTDVILESAYFAPTVVRATSKRLGLSTESSRRFERGVDPHCVLTALQRASTCIVEWAGGTPTQDWIDIYPEPIAPMHVNLSVKAMQAFLGCPIDATDVRHILQRIGCDVSGSGDRVRVQVPTFRPDITRAVDCTEEVVRLYGYDRIPETRPTLRPAVLHRPAGWDLRRRCLERLRGLGFCEAVHYAFHGSKAAQDFALEGMEAMGMANPLGQEPMWLKTTLLSGLVTAAAGNLRHGEPNVRLAELRPVYSKGPDGTAREGWRLACLITGDRYPFSWTTDKDVVDFFDIKGLVEQVTSWHTMTTTTWQSADLPQFLHPGQGAWCYIGTQRVALCGLLHPRLAKAHGLPPAVGIAQWDWSVLCEAAASPEAYHPLNRFPSVRRDVAFLVDAPCSAGELLAIMHDAGEPWVTDITLFDQYAGERLAAGQKSLAFAITFQHPERTLTDTEVNAAHARIVAHVQQQRTVEIRQ